MAEIALSPVSLEPAQARALELLERNKAFRLIKRDFLRDLVECGHEWHYAKGQPLIVQGGPSDKLFVILNGHVRVEHRFSEGDLESVAELGIGEPLGEMALLANERRFNSVRATTEVDVLEIDGNYARNVFALDPDLLEAFVRLVQERVRRAGPPRPWI